jgi:Xaa-Pro dipeptidase
MRGFPTKEYQNRVSKLQNKMQENYIDIILITSPHNFRYFTGLNSYFWESPTRPWFLLIHQLKDPIAVIPSIGETALKQTWIKNIKTWPSPQPNDEGISVLKNNIKNLIPQQGNIGCELGPESHLRMSIEDFDNLRKDFSEYNFIDTSHIIWKLRMIKSENEIKKIKKIISITSEVFDNLPNELNIGMSEIEICNIFKKELINKGADHTLYMSCTSGNGGYNQIICDPSEKKIEDGDILIIDTGSTFDGYFCDFDRNYGFGKISKESKEAYNILWEATEAGLNIAKPGVKCSDVNNAMYKILKKAGSLSNNVGRMGHGLGLQLTEPPSIMVNENALLDENMIITIEPCFEYQPNKMLVHEENILITKNGHERLTTRTPKTIPLIS